MSTISKTQIKNNKIKTQQSDIIIAPDGTINISFLWDDLTDIFHPDKAVANLKKESPFWKFPSNNEICFSSHNEYKECNLCPKECSFDRLNSTHPTCGDSEFRISNSGITFGDEKCIVGTQGSGAIMLSGCPLTCPSCHNPEKVAWGEISSPNDFLSLCEEFYNNGAHNIQILSPTVHLPKLREALHLLKNSNFPLPIVLKSSGYETISQLKLLTGLVDIYLPDLKFGSFSDWAKRSGVEDYFTKATEAINEMYSQTGEAVYDKFGILQKGLLIRHINAPLPLLEKKLINDYLSTLPKGIIISYENKFVSFE